MSTIIQLKPEYLMVLTKIQEQKKTIEARTLSEKCQMPYEKLMSGAIFTLTQQGLVNYSEQEVTIFTPTLELQGYIKKGLPERQIFELFVRNGRKEAVTDEFIQEVESVLGFDRKLIFIGIANMKKKRWILTSKATSQEQLYLNLKSPELSEEEKYLQFLGNKSKFTMEEIPPSFIEAHDALYKRKLITREKYTNRLIQLTDLGKSISPSNISVINNEIANLTPDMIKSGSWKQLLPNLKPFDVSIPGPKMPVGKLHPLTIIIQQIREVFHSMGFEEIKGPVVELAFYNFDSLFQPQDHPAREMQDTFYLSNPLKGKLPDKKCVAAVKATHESGGTSGSTGWKYSWSESEAQRMVLRTHTTATTIRRLSRITSETRLPMKVFCVDRVFRNENEDRTHLAQFQQIDGIVIGKNLSLADLRGQIIEFYKRMGFSKVITRPAFFPYTSPSMEAVVYSEKLGKWLEMGGSGVFRPEVLSPWGLKDPIRVIAWGLGLERLAMISLQREDIRDLYQSPISWLREASY